MVLPWEFHTSWEQGTVGKCEMLQHLSSGCALPQWQHSNALAWTGEEETGTQLCSTQQSFRRCSGRGMSRGTIAGRARLKAPAYADQFPLSLPGDLGQVHVEEQSQSRSVLSRAARDLASCPMYRTAPLRELLTHESWLPTCSLSLPQNATACSSCGAVNLSSPESNKLNLSPKRARAVFCKQRQHKSCLSPSRLTLFSLPPHLLLAK